MYKEFISKDCKHMIERGFPIHSQEEVEDVTTKVILEFERHGKRQSFPDDRTKDADPDLRLTPEGRAQADARGRVLHPQPEVSLGLGSPRTRTQETALRTILAETGEIGPDDSFEQIEAKVAEHLKVGKKMRIDERLNFTDAGPIGPDGKKAYLEKRYMAWIVGASDRDAIEKGDTISSTYTREAGNIAELILHYTNVAENFNKIVAKDGAERYKKFGNQIERYLGTHQGIAESFVAKVLELVKGQESKDAFIKSVGAGFAETEGVRIEILNKGSEQKILMTYILKNNESGNTKQIVTFGKDVLDKIIDDRDTFETRVAKSAATLT